MARSVKYSVKNKIGDYRNSDLRKNYKTRAHTKK